MKNKPEETPSCRDCRFWHCDDEIVGDCRYNPPSLLAVSVQNAGESGMVAALRADGRDPMSLTADVRWPRTYGSEWCGKFESETRRQTTRRK
jgi:hypothetical protein